jgi:osmotically-inducible protein OsmY
MEVDKAEIERALEEVAGVEAAVQVDRGRLVVSGMVSSAEERQAALDILSDMVPGIEIVDDLTVMTEMPEEIEGMDLSEADVGGFVGATPESFDTEALEPGDFTDQRFVHDPTAASGPSGTHPEDSDEPPEDDADEGDEVYIPPTDPVRDRDNEILGGFQTTAMDDDVEPRSRYVGGIADEGLVDAVLQELEQDASTNGLEIEVTSYEGVVRLRGKVQDLEDAENAEAVAARVPGVREVLDELELRAG